MLLLVVVDFRGFLMLSLEQGVFEGLPVGVAVTEGSIVTGFGGLGFLSSGTVLCWCALIGAVHAIFQAVPTGLRKY